MVDSLPPRLYEEDPDRRAQLDSELGVATWWSPTRRVVTPVPATPDDDGLTPPPWWHGDEEASQTFITAQGGPAGG